MVDEVMDYVTSDPIVFVALDKGATGKAVDMVKTLGKVVPTKLMVLPRDLKSITWNH